MTCFFIVISFSDSAAMTRVASIANRVDGGHETIQETPLAKYCHGPAKLYDYHKPEQAWVVKEAQQPQPGAKHVQIGYALEEPPYRHEANVDAWHLKIIEPVFKLLDHCLWEIKVGKGDEGSPSQGTVESLADTQGGKGVVLRCQPMAEHRLLNEIYDPEQDPRLGLQRQETIAEMVGDVLGNVMDDDQYRACHGKGKEYVVEIVADKLHRLARVHGSCGCAKFVSRRRDPISTSAIWTCWQLLPITSATTTACVTVCFLHVSPVPYNHISVCVHKLPGRLPKPKVF